MKRTLLLLAVLSLSATVAQAQSFNSGSTGADGALVADGICTTLQVPASGVFNFTTITVNGARCLVFLSNQRNTPVIMLAQGDVVINGDIGAEVQSSGFGSQTPGPGGFFGGAGAEAGFGPGGGAPGQTGIWVGPLSLVPLIGGSGGGGQPAGSNVGGGGGGAIVIASSTVINCSGHITARGSGTNSGGAGPGAGGAIRLVANSISGGCGLDARGGLASSPFLGGNSANAGIIRIEAPSVNYTGTATPNAVITLVVNPQIIPTSSTASLAVASIGGFPVLSDAGSRPGTVDVVLPRALSDPIALVVQATKIPIGTQVNLNLSGSTGMSYTPGTLAGSFDQSTATLQVTGLNRTAETHLFVFATFDVPAGQQAALLNPAGPNQVAKVQIRAAPGRPSTMAFLRRDGSEIDPKKIPPKLLAYLNQPNR
jgi:hypothetical protein